MRRSAWAAGLALLAVAASLATHFASAQSRAPGRGVRTIVLVRHGLYDRDDPRDEFVGRGLTPEGREQARITAGRLAHFPLRIDVLRSSTMTRARETAAIFADSLGLVPIASSDLSECTPPTERRDIAERESAAAMDSCRLQLERAFAALFRPSPQRDTTEVVACHGNVIRYFLCRALGLDPLKWLRFGIQNTSLTVIRVRPDGTMQVIAYGDFGHLPPNLVTVIRPTAPRDSSRAAPSDSAAAR